MFTAATNGDMDALSSVLSLRGENVPESSSSLSDSGTLPNLPGSYTTGFPSLLAEVIKLGDKANGYKLGATGPQHYDCSGLVWKACVNLGFYSGPRFTTSTFTKIIDGWCDKVEWPSQPGDIVLWKNRHMGVSGGTMPDSKYTDKNDDAIDDITGEIVIYHDQMYSARSTSLGIGWSNIDGDSGYFGFSPTFYRIRG
jgi:hypothetical protein